MEVFCEGSLLSGCLLASWRAVGEFPGMGQSWWVRSPQGR